LAASAIEALSQGKEENLKITPYLNGWSAELKWQVDGKPFER
jgi:hypothetical protein